MCVSVWVLAAVCSAQVAFAQGGKKQITLEDLWKSNTFRVKDVPGFNAMHDGKLYTSIDREDKHQYIRVYDLATGKVQRTIFDNALQKAGNSEISVDEYAFSKDERKMLLLTESENIYRRSVLYKAYIYDIASGKVELLDDNKVLHPTFSPDGSQVAFVKDNNLYYKDLATGTVTAVTTDAEKNKIRNGNCDWVYEEEFSFTRAYEWSADGRYLAYYRFDESKVPEYTITKYTGLYPEEYTYKYPKAGEPNSTIQIKIYNIAGKTTTNADLGSETDQYIPRIKWTRDAEGLCVYRLNRLQNHLELLWVDAKSGAAKPIYTDDNKSYVSIDDEITFLPGGHAIIIRSERNGYSHLYSWDWDKQKLTDLTEGNYDVDALTGIDTVHKLLYYTAAKTTPMQRSLYATDWAGRKTRELTPEPGMHTITPCEGYSYFLDKYSTLNKVPVYYLRNEKGQIIRTLEENKKLDSTIHDYALGDIKFIKVKGVQDSLNAYMITPPGFDPAKKYPVLMFQYSGPGSQQVLDVYPVGNLFWHQMLAEKGYIIVCADGVGTGFRGEEFRKRTYLQLGKYESDDQIAVARNLGELPYVDKNRIGIWGWSYGGFMSATCIFKGADVFKMAIAVAPVTNWRYYDNIYTERYMRTPKENAKGYDENAPEKMAASLKGKFLLVHGTADDNVHFQNSIMLTTAMIKAGVSYDSEYYPDKAHGISGGATRYHLYRRMTDFVLNNL